MVKAVGFDYGGVLTSNSGEKFSIAVSKLLGIPLGLYYSVYFSMNDLVNNGTLTKDVFRKLFLEKLSKEDLFEKYEMLEKQFSLSEINQEMITLVTRVKNKGYKVGLLSNNVAGKRRKFEELGFEKLFDVIMISGEEGISKPDPELFTRFVKRLGVEIDELVFIDDSKTSLRTAHEVGCIPILFTGFEKLTNDLQKLDVL